MGTPSMMNMALPPLDLAGSPSGLIPPSPFSLYSAEVTNPGLSRAGSRNNSLLALTERARTVAAEGKSAERGTENPWVG